MPKKINLIGQKFGKLTVIGEASSRNNRTYWLCQCECGNQKEIQTYHLTGGLTKSCGCLVKKSKEKVKKCLYCGKELKNHQYKFCSQECAYKYRKDENIRLWKEGKISGVKGKGISEIVRNYMLEKVNYKCEICGWGEMNPYSRTIPLEIHHIDGDYTNNKEENLQILCPNCHSLTNNYKSLNTNCTR